MTQQPAVTPPTQYYVPSQSHWPITGSIALFFSVIGAVNWIHGHPTFGHWVMVLGLFFLCYMMYHWFGDVIRESRAGLYSAQLDKSFRLGMSWFIFSEVMFFTAFFGALFYIREFSVPWLGGEGVHALAGQILWPEFKATWPLLHYPDPNIPSPTGVINPMGLPLINTALLLSSGVTLTIAHWALRKNARGLLVLFLGLTLLLGWTFMGIQGYEYVHAYKHLGLTLGSGVYGSTFFMLTGFHGFHVMMGSIILLAVLVRCIKGHFTPERHFAFEAAAWYWHFVDVVWLGLFILVYWL